MRGDANLVAFSLRNKCFHIPRVHAYCTRIGLIKSRQIVDSARFTRCSACHNRGPQRKSGLVGYHHAHCIVHGVKCEIAGSACQADRVRHGVEGPRRVLAERTGLASQARLKNSHDAVMSLRLSIRNRSCQHA